MPVIMVPEMHAGAPKNAIERILICTAGGEPGKSDIQFGGRIARRARAGVTLFHVRAPEASDQLRARVDTHLERGRLVLAMLGVRAEVEAASGPGVVEGVLDEARRGDYDLVVIGAPAPRSSQRLYWANMASPIVRAIDRPLLIVPAAGG
jgi:sulfate transport system ATP-binding protein